MCCSRWRRRCTTRCRPGVAEVDQQCDGPSGVAVRKWKQSGSNPNHDCDTEAADSSPNEGSGSGHPCNARILQSEDRTNAAVCGAEACSIAAAKRISRISSHHRDQKNLRNDQHTFHHVIDRKLCGKRGVAEPREENQRQQEREPRDAVKRVIMIEWCTQLRDCGGKYQVEEQIGPTRATQMPFVSGANLGRAEKGHDYRANSACSRFAVRSESRMP